MSAGATPLAHTPIAWQRWLVPRSSDWVPAFLYLGVLLDYLVIYHTTLVSWGTLVLTGALGLLVASERWEYWRYGEQVPWRVRVLLLVVNIVLIESAVLVSYEGIGAFLYLILPLKAWLWFGRGAGYVASMSVSAVYVAKSIFDAGMLAIPIELILSSCILFATAVAFVLTISHLATQERLDRQHAERLLAELAASHQELAASHQALATSHHELAVYATRAADAAAVAERNRLARDIHDGLGHYLTALNIQLERALTFQETNRPEAQRALGTSKRLAHEALADVRRSVGLLRPHPAPFSLVAMLHDLLDAGASSAPDVTIDVQGDETRFALALRMVLYRVAQEGLTNVRRHAQASQAQLTLVFGETQATLEVCDNGVGFAAPAPDTAPPTGGNYGLQGLHERVALVGGTLRLTSTPGAGTTLLVTLPMRVERGG